jgi:hypothetical protein
VFFADRIRHAHSIGEGIMKEKLYSIAKIQLLPSRITPLESASTLYLIRRPPPRVSLMAEGSRCFPGSSPRRNSLHSDMRSLTKGRFCAINSTDLLDAPQ